MTDPQDTDSDPNPLTTGAILEDLGNHLEGIHQSLIALRAKHEAAKAKYPEYQKENTTEDQQNATH